MKSIPRVAERALLSVCLLLFLASPGHTQQNSRARVVRLSFTEGTVTVQPPGADTWSTAPVNTPIQEGFKLATANDSFAEVEFENARSTVRIGQLSEVEFTQLQLSPEGDHINRMTLTRGYATFHALPSSGDVYEVRVADATFTPSGKSEFRLDIDENAVRAEVFKGEVEFAGTEGSETLSKNMMLEFTPGSTEPYQIVQGIVPDDWDQWVKQRDEVAASAATGPSGAYNAALSASYYGWGDLTSYGTWNAVPGYGMAWFPAVSYGWSPYAFGHWCWYPSFGYTWIAGEPWGWLPYHYGNWFYNAVGWFWVPGSLTTWQPALVTWYQGPGWVGWAPRNVPVHGSPNCQMGRTCMTVVSNDVMREGKPVTPRTVYSVDLATAQGRPVEKPDVAPSALAWLPGTPAHRPVFLARQPGGASANPALAVSERSSDRGSSAAPPAPVRVNRGRVAPSFSAGRPAPGAVNLERAPRAVFGQGRPAPSSSQAWSGSHSGPRSLESGASVPKSPGSWSTRSSSTGTSGSNRSSGTVGGGSGSARVSSGGGGRSGGAVSGGGHTGGGGGGGAGPRGGGAGSSGGRR